MGVQIVRCIDPTRGISSFFCAKKIYGHAVSYLLYAGPFREKTFFFVVGALKTPDC